MNIPYKQYGAMIAVAVAAFSVGRFTGPTKIQIKEVEKTSTKQSQTTNQDKKQSRTIKETRLPDGTVIKETRVDKETSTETKTKSASSKETSKEETRESRPSYRLGVIYWPNLKGVQLDNYAVTLETRIVSELYAGVVAGLDKTIGLSVSLGF
jgi:hypothetical protein